MINAVIIENESMDEEGLLGLLQQIDHPVKVVAILRNIEESILFFSKPQTADLVFCDVQLNDGHSFAIFKTVEVGVPVIFIAGNDSSFLQTFEKYGIEYLLKPVSREALSRIIKEYSMLENHFNAHALNGNSSPLLNSVSIEKRTRILAKKGIENVLLLLTDIVMFYTEKKVVLALDNHGKKYIISKSLSELEDELDQKQFFRANRQCLINIDYIKSFKAYERVKILVELNINHFDFPIVISQETAIQFRKWVAKA